MEKVWLGLPGSFQSKGRGREELGHSCWEMLEGKAPQAVETQFACPSRAVKEGKGPRCAGWDLKPAEEMGTGCLFTIPHVSVGDKGTDFTPHFQPPLQNKLSKKWDLLREHLPHGKGAVRTDNQWLRHCPALKPGPNLPGFPAPGKKHILSTLHAHFQPLLVYLYRPIFNGMIPHCLCLEKGFTCTSKDWRGYPALKGINL